MMKANFARTLLLLCALPWLSSTAFAWGKTGHRVTGAIAEHHLSDEARSGISAILGVEDLAEASTWADFMRASPDVYWQEFAAPFHYVTIPVDKAYRDVEAPPEGDAITAMETFRITLRDEQASIGEKQIALRFLVHIIGDLHQPLHAGNGTDRGGNDYNVSFFGHATNLHSVWDRDLINHSELSFSELADWLNRRVTAAQITAWSQIDPAVWADEGAAIRDRIYPEGERDIRWNYVYGHREIMRQRLTQAGIRMALYLNDVFKR